MPRLTVINPDIVAHCIKHPARGEPWSLRTLSTSIGMSRGTLGDLVTGRRSTVSTTNAHRISRALGVPLPVLFRTGVEAESNTKEDAA